jgi:integrase
MEPRKRSIQKNGQVKWEVDFGYDDAGVRRRPYFTTEAGADEAIQLFEKEERKHGDFWARLTAPERRTVVATLVEIKAANLTLPEVWIRFKKQKEAIDKQAVVTSKAFADVVAEFRKRKLAAGKTDKYVKDTGDFFLKFGAGREQRPIHEILPDELEQWLEDQAKSKNWSLSTKRSYTLAFSNLWEVAIAKGWAGVNIVTRLEPIKKPGQVVRIYPNEDTLNIMAAAMASPLTQKIIAPLALGLFGCMRPEEINSTKAVAAGLSAERLFGWHDIDLENGLVTVRVQIAKTGDQRTIRLQPTAVAWLKLAKELNNPLPPVNERRLIDACCELIGLGEWIRDGLRKNCCTHLRAVYKNDYDVVKDCGNSVRILLKHYAGLHVPEAVSLAHWEITPDKVRQFMKSAQWENVLKAAAQQNSPTADAEK